MKRVGGRPEDTCRHDCGVFPPLPRSTGVLFLLLLTRWWILPSTAINPFYTAPLTCEIYLRTHILSQHTHWRVIAGAHTHTEAEQSVLSFSFFCSSVLAVQDPRKRSNANTLPRTFAGIVCMQKHSGVPPDSTRCEWHPTSTKVISDSSSAWLLTDQPD